MTRFGGMRDRWRRVEGPTWVVAFCVYGGWVALTAAYRVLPLAVFAPLGAWLIAWQSSLQHEASHFRPLGRRTATALGYPPLSLWLPFSLYRATHLLHHRESAITDPGSDPESFYVTSAQWDRAGWLTRRVLLANQTLVGRLLLGSFLMWGRFFARQVTELRSPAYRRHWLVHLPGLVAVLGWLQVCGVPWLVYGGLVVVPGTSLLLLRSFAEHRVASEPALRSVSVDAGRLLGLLYLNNNLHVAHHRNPSVPWYDLPAYDRSRRDRFEHTRSGGRWSSYGALVRRHLFRAIAPPLHPGFGASAVQEPSPTDP